MVLELTASSKDAESILDDRISSLCNDIRIDIEHFTSSDIQTEVLNILRRAVDIDQKIRRQAARVKWFYCKPKDKFLPQEMSLANKEASNTENQSVLLVVAPGLMKRGKSNGVDFDNETLLVRSKVYLAPYRVVGL